MPINNVGLFRAIFQNLFGFPLFLLWEFESFRSDAFGLHVPHLAQVCQAVWDSDWSVFDLVLVFSFFGLGLDQVSIPQSLGVVFVSTLC